MTLLSLFSFVFFSLQSPTVSVEMVTAQDENIPVEFYNVSQYQNLNPRTSCWVKVELETSISGDYILKGGKDYLRNMRFYNSDKKCIGQGNHVELNLNPGHSIWYVYYSFIDQKEANVVSVKLEEARHYFENRSSDAAIKTSFLVLVIFLFFLSTAFYLIGGLTEVIYLAYASYLFSIFYFFAYQYGFAGQAVELIDHIHPALVWISSASITITYTLFIRSFLNIPQQDPLLEKVIQFSFGFMAFIIISETTSFFTGSDLQHSVLFTTFSLLVQVGIMIFILIRLFQMRTMLSRIALVGASILCLTTVVGQLASTLRLVEQANYMIMAGLSLEIFIFNVGIGIRMWLSNKATRDAQSKLIDQLKVNEKIQEENKAELELKVEERTIQLSVKNKQNELLLGEIHHRVKNNLQTITSLLSIQQRKLQDGASKQAIQESKNRVMAMGLIHEHLYQNATFAEVNFESYIEELLDSLIKTYATQKNEIKLETLIAPLQIEVDNAILLGLIVNELVNNCIKHAYEGVDQPELKVVMKEEGSEVLLMVKDNGISKLVGLDSSKSFGWKMVNILCEKMRGRLEVEEKEGLSVKIYFDKSKMGLKPPESNDLNYTQASTESF